MDAKTYTPNQLAEDIYDLIKVNALSKNQNDWWAELSHKHAKDSKRNIHEYIRHKTMEWEGNTVRIGKHITITITDDRRN